jgi:hypothetical protein
MGLPSYRAQAARTAQQVVPPEVVAPPEVGPAADAHPTDWLESVTAPDA